MTLSEEIKREAHRLGFQAVGISLITSQNDTQPAPVSPAPPPPILTQLSARLLAWLERSYHGAMAWLEREPDRRTDPRKVLAGCRSVISLGMNYYTEDQADERAGHGRIARYAWGSDYHNVMLDRLKQLASRLADLAPGTDTKCYVDTGPVMEKAWAQQGGLGWIGKHSNLVSAQYGSWLLLGEILTTLDLEPDEPAADLCGSCTICIQACPTGAIVEPYVLDARRCISYLTIELPADQAIPEDLARKMGNRIFGCDDCLDVCPYNVNAEPTHEPAFQPSALTLAPRLESLAEMSASEFIASFRGSPIRRPKHAGFQRNVAAALRNHAPSAHPPPSRPVPTP